MRALSDNIAQAAVGAVRDSSAAALRGQAAQVSLHGAYEVLLKALQNRTVFCRCADHFVCTVLRSSRQHCTPAACMFCL